MQGFDEGWHNAFAQLVGGYPPRQPAQHSGSMFADLLNIAHILVAPLAVGMPATALCCSGALLAAQVTLADGLYGG